ncbi:MAG: tetratricopeptide repeat protein [Bryobacteraceae bacterium]
MTRYALIAMLVLGSLPVLPQVPAAPSRSAVKRQAPGEQNQIDSSEALFTVLAAINVAGYDDQVDAVSTHPFRHTLRTQLLAAASKLDSAWELRRFYRDHALKDPKAELSRYISYGLLINGPPDFGYQDPDMLRPADVSSLEGLSPLLAAFYKEAKLEELWRKAQPAYDQMIEAYHEPVTNSILRTNAYLRNATSGYLGRRFLIYVDVLGAPNQVQTRLYGDDYFVVVTPSPAPQIEGIRHAYLHYLVDPLGFKFAEDIKKKHALGDYAQGAPLLEQGYKEDFVLLTTECAIKAVEARMDRRPAAVDQALKEGYVLTPALAEQLAIYEKQDVAMRLYFPNMIAALDFKKEEKRLENVEFANAREQRVVRAAQNVKAPELTGAAKTLADAEQAYTDRDLDRAKNTYLRALEETSDRPLHAKSYYGLARIAILQRDPETGDRLFRKALELDPDPETKAWSLLYLARLADSQGERDEAQEHYKAALAVDGAPETVRNAAEKGIKEAFVNGQAAKQ